MYNWFVPLTKQRKVRRQRAPDSKTIANHLCCKGGHIQVAMIDGILAEVLRPTTIAHSAVGVVDEGHRVRKASEKGEAPSKSDSVVPDRERRVPLPGQTVVAPSTGIPRLLWWHRCLHLRSSSWGSRWRLSSKSIVVFGVVVPP